MRSINNIIASLVGIFSPKGRINATTKPATTVSTPVGDDMQFCLRHGDIKPRRRFKDSGVSAHGSHFVVNECPICHDFIARATDRVTGRPFVLFRGKYYHPRHHVQQRAQFRTGRTANATA